MYSLQEVQEQVDSFDKMKFIDEDGVEKISGRELAKALGYSKWQNFQSAIRRTNDQIKASGGADSELLTEVSKQLKVTNQYGAESVREITDYHLTRRQAINVTNNADTTKPQVALTQEYLYDTSEVGERAINIYNKLNDRDYIANREDLRISSKLFSGKCLEHGTKQSELGIVHNACDEAMYGASTNEIKEAYGKSNRPKADFIGATMCAAESLAKKISSMALDKEDANGVDECVSISSEIHGDIGNYITEKTGKTPLELVTGEDVKLVEKRYNKLTKEQLEAIEKEY